MAKLQEQFGLQHRTEAEEMEKVKTDLELREKALAEKEQRLAALAASGALPAAAGAAPAGGTPVYEGGCSGRAGCLCLGVLTSAPLPCAHFLL